MANILDEIVAHKRKEVAAAQRLTPEAQLRATAEEASAPRGFREAVTAPCSQGIHLIAEIKRRSPSAGLIRADFDPAAIARVYASAGASAISVLTDAHYFDGRLDYVRQVREAVTLPVLRKDFVVDAYQVWEARSVGADAILLIAEVLTPAEIAQFTRLAGALSMSVLIEAYHVDLLRGVVHALGDLIPDHVLLGINNRDLTVQRTDIATTARLAAQLEDTSMLVSESGIKSRADVVYVQQAGARAILVGETIMAADDMAAKIAELLGRSE